MKLLIIAAAAAAALAQTPVVDCVVQQNNQSGIYTAYFGYKNNPNPGNTIPAGSRNFVDSSAMLREQPPTSFPNTSEHILFSAVIMSPAGWHLIPGTSEQIATASANMAQSCQAAVGATLA